MLEQSAICERPQKLKEGWIHSQVETLWYPPKTEQIDKTTQTVHAQRKLIIVFLADFNIYIFTIQ